MSNTTSSAFGGPKPIAPEQAEIAPIPSVEAEQPVIKTFEPDPPSHSVFTLLGIILIILAVYVLACLVL